VTQPESRGQWTSRFGFVLAAAGSAIGLGNIWRFPYTAGQNGGGAFVLVYLGFVLLVGLPVLLVELSVGRHTQRNAVGAFKALAPKSWWPWLGGLGVVAGFGILSFYSVIAGYTLAYAWDTATGQFSAGLSSAASAEIFAHLSGDPTASLLLTALFLVLTALVVRSGIGGGIERASRILMPVLFLFMLGLAIRALTLDGAKEGLAFLFHLDFSKITASALGSALGQALFSLSLGMGAMVTYGSYLGKKENLHVSAAGVVFFDTLIALLAGVIIFPALFHAGTDPAAGPGLVFVAMPTIFDSMPAGTVFGVVFYLLLAIAALTSTISLLEVIVAYAVDEHGWRRERAVWLLTLVCFVVAVPSALALGANATLSTLLGSSGGFLDLMSIVFGNYALSIGALGFCIFVGWKWGIPKALAEIEGGHHRFVVGPLWGFLVRYVCPVAVGLVLIYIIVTKQYF